MKSYIKKLKETPVRTVIRQGLKLRPVAARRLWQLYIAVGDSVAKCKHVAHEEVDDEDGKTIECCSICSNGPHRRKALVGDCSGAAWV